MMRRSVTLAVGTAIVLVLGMGSEAWGGRNLVAAADSWSYQLQGDVGRVAASDADVVVVDPDHAGPASRFQTKPDGRRRAALAYLSIGEAERGRPYWAQCCASTAPSWLTERTQGWDGNFLVNFWEPGWKAIVASRVRDFMARGYDGLYLDRVDSYENVSAPGGSRSAMITFVEEVAAMARAIKGDAAIVVQNAEELLDSDAYVRVLDGIAKEDLMHGVNHDGLRNPADMIEHSVALLKRAAGRGRRVFVVEYLTGDIANAVAGEIRGHGFVPLIAERSLGN